MDSLTPIVIIVTVVVLIIKFVVAILYANKLDEISNSKNADVSIWGWTMFLTLFFGIVGMLIAALLEIAIPNDNIQKIEYESESENIKKWVKGL